MGGLGSGRYVRHKGVPRWTQGKQRELEEALEREARIRAERRAAAKERARIRINERRKAKRAEARAAGLPRPYAEGIKANKERRRAAGLWPNYEAPGASTPRWRRWWAKQKAFLKAWTAAIREDRRRARRVAKGLPPTPKSASERAAESRERRRVAREAYLIIQWWSPEISAGEAKTVLQGLYPAFDEYQLSFEYNKLLGCARHAKLNLNRFILSRPADGIQLASERRAIFHELYHAAIGGPELPDVVAILEQEAATKTLADVPAIASAGHNPGWLRNVMQKSMDFGMSLVDLEMINREVLKSRKSQRSKSVSGDFLTE